MSSIFQFTIYTKHYQLFTKSMHTENERKIKNIK